MSHYKIVIAPDSFKESMTAKEVAQTIQEGFQNIFDEHVIYEIIPMADGGEGTTEALREALDATNYTVKVKDPLIRDIEANYARSDKHQTAIIELAAASGLALLDDNERNPLCTTTYGTGQLINDALNHNVKKIILGIGGSATNDGGVGMLQALGISFKDQYQHEIQPGGINLANIERIDVSHINPKLQDIEIKAACDVTNPLLGQNGAAVVYGPQKGATQKMIPKLDSALNHYHDKIELELNKTIKHIPGAGAAGGTGAALLAFLDAQLQPGIEVVLEETHFTNRVKDANLVITGEGKIDKQTIYGKTPIGVAKASKAFHIPVIAICGSLGKDYQEIYYHGIDSVFSIIEHPGDLNDALQNGTRYLTHTATNIARLIQLKIKGTTIDKEIF
ncbi:glycerate kinase [Staphylococcus saccharolyticus]|uniref:glycerate kinase n=1 Tax=Staphylococcus saccharolyticus TaxID=33028 RepID=UPI00102E05EC|nr:glycerate kinase [Staphylococcus saccharolyticus]MBL7573691.1 glycerate kinase [Staphylococcus saccharolyticus]MBL7584519.1 glycerate kinase [Staphylococcus saccharolyticus]MBL7639381.1 glycerate kinase [Staphylococcus saccharolyticus]QRJ68700.1 glycerate kinase [Staphylococcus saccharolyticus]TAA92018.1 glycerate kinase [Staphylococcus saccharolyticus]